MADLELYEFEGEKRQRYACLFVCKGETEVTQVFHADIDVVLPKEHPDEGMVVDLKTQKVVGAWLPEYSRWMVEGVSP